VVASQRGGHRVISAPYMCGEHYADPTQPKFRSHMNSWREYLAGNVYLHEFIGEDKISYWINILSLIILIVMFGEVVR
jgi:ech hydrogenase subunit A